MLSVSFISASYLMDEGYNNVNSLNTNVGNENVVNEVTKENVNVTDVISASKQFKQYEDENGRLPVNVEIADQNYTVEQFLYLLSGVIINTYSSNNSSSVPVLKNIGSACSKGSNSEDDLDKNEYVNASASIVEFMDATNQAPNFLKSEKLGNISFNSTVDGFVSVVNYMSDNNVLPESIHFDATNTVVTNTVESNVTSSSSSDSSRGVVSDSTDSYSAPYSGNSYSGDGWGLVNSLKSQLSGMTYGSDGDCYTFSQIVYDQLSAAGYRCGIYQGHTEMGNHRVPYVYIGSNFYWLETCRVVNNGWGSGTDWTVPYDSWVPEYVYVSS